MLSLFDYNSKSFSPLKHKFTTQDFLSHFSKELNTRLNHLHRALLPQVLRDEIFQEFMEYYSANDALIPQLSLEKCQQIKIFFIQNLETQAQFYSNTHPYPLPPSSISAKQSGVEIDCFIHDGTNYITGIFDGPVHSKVGMSEKSKSKKSGSTTSNKKFHAETEWFERNQAKLNSFLTSRPSMAGRKPTNMQDSWLFHVNQGPRIEFFISSSPCQECQLHFVKLRELLNQLNIFIPIHIFSISSFNTHETERSQFAIVDFKGNFVPTNLYLATKYDTIARGFFSLNHEQYTTLVNNQDLYAIHHELLNQKDDVKKEFLNFIYHQLTKEHKFENLVFLDILSKCLKHTLPIKETTIKQIKDRLKLQPAKPLPETNISHELSLNLIDFLNPPELHPPASKLQA